MTVAVKLDMTCISPKVLGAGLNHIKLGVQVNELIANNSYGLYPDSVNDFMFYYMFSVCKIDIENPENPETLLDCLQKKYDGPSEGEYVYTYIDAYGDEQTSKYNWGGERNFIEHMNNHFDSSYSCVALEVTNYAYHGNHLSHSRYNDPDNKFHTTTSYQFDNQYGSLFCNPFTLNSRDSFRIFTKLLHVCENQQKFPGN